MTTKQKAIVKAWAISVLLLGLFPPFLKTTHYEGFWHHPYPAGHEFVFTTRRIYQTDDQLYQLRVDGGRIISYLCILSGASACALILAIPGAVITDQSPSAVNVVDTGIAVTMAAADAPREGVSAASKPRPH